jgi:hypothetical protein
MFNFNFGSQDQMVIAGALGGVVRWLTLRSSWVDGLISIVIGGICSAYLGPVCEQMLQPMIGGFVLDPSARAGLAGFLIGIGGVGVSSFVLDLVSQRQQMLMRKINADQNQSGDKQ